MTLRLAGSSVTLAPLEALAERLGTIAGPIPLVSDETVLRLHGAPLLDRLPVAPLIVPAGEAAKSWAVLERLLVELAALGTTRDTPVIALGGGSIGDVAGLAAHLFMRGCPVIQVPTTFLAQIDSALGGKTAIDFAGVKNLVGAFHVPAHVHIDVTTLATLPDPQLRAGYAELVKYGLIDDPALFAWCEDHGGALLAGHRPSLEHAVMAGLTAKARLVEGDVEDRSGQRALLNLGHSFAHAIEAEAGFGVLHGEAVAVGLVLAHALSERLGLAPAADKARLARHLAAHGLPTRPRDLGVPGPALLDHLARDKKNRRGALNLVLTRGIGRAFLAEGVPPDAVAALLAEA